MRSELKEESRHKSGGHSATFKECGLGLVASAFCPIYTVHWGFSRGSDGKESSCSAGDLGSIPGLGRSPGRKHGNPLEYFCLENPHGQRSLVGYSPQGRKESDTTE